jgi:hypothetical protein
MIFHGENALQIIEEMLLRNTIFQLFTISKGTYLTTERWLEVVHLDVSSVLKFE